MHAETKKIKISKSATKTSLNNEGNLSQRDDNVPICQQQKLKLGHLKEATGWRRPSARDVTIGESYKLLIQIALIGSYKIRQDFSDIMFLLLIDNKQLGQENK